MLIKVTPSKIEEFCRVCTAEHVFGSRAVTAIAAYGTEHDVHKFWLSTEEDKTAAFHLNGSVLTVIKKDSMPVEDVLEMTKQQEIHEIDSDWDLCEKLHQLLGGFTESSYYMVYEGRKFADSFDDIHPASLQDVYSILQQSHEYYRTHLKYDPWAGHLESCMKTGLTAIYQLERDGKPIGTGSVISRDGTHAAIAAVAVIPEYRLQGIGSYITKFLVNRILDEGRTPCLISGYDEVAELYRKIGFVPVGRWGELYI